MISFIIQKPIEAGCVIQVNCNPGKEEKPYILILMVGPNIT
jgi:hypothetical protein